jgi:hypothetical protein
MIVDFLEQRYISFKALSRVVSLNKWLRIFHSLTGYFTSGDFQFRLKRWPFL